MKLDEMHDEAQTPEPAMVSGWVVVALVPFVMVIGAWMWSMLFALLEVFK